MSASDEAREFLAAHPGLRSIEVLFADVSGIFRGKQYPASDLPGLAAKGMISPASHLMLDAKGHCEHPKLNPGFEGDPDVVFKMVPGTLRMVPWRDESTAQVITEAFTLDGAPHFADPRQILKRALQLFTDMHLTPVIALELEFYLLDARKNPPEPVSPADGRPRLTGTQTMSMEVLEDFLPFVTEVKHACAAQGVPLTTILTEYGDSQFEANLRHVPDALAACDDAMCLKRIIKGVARRNGQQASFMAKPFGGASGSGLHVHISLLDSDGRNIFGIKGGDEKLRHAVGGQLKLMPESMAVFCPNANSFRRLAPGNFVPIEPTWSANERGVAVRIPVASEKDARFEHRVAGADACPYLVTAAILAAAHYGLTEKIDPGPMTREVDAARPEPLPNRWLPAVEALAAGETLRRYFGQTFVDVYLRMKRYEEERYHAEIPDRDLDWYFRTV
jgi:glutamine synthetase